MSTIAASDPIGQLPTTLYRYFDADGTLLYVGITSRYMVRMHQHAEGARWWRRAVRCELVHFPDRASALAAEAHEIVERKPLFNVNGAPRERMRSSPGQMPLPGQGYGTGWIARARRLRALGLTVDEIARVVEQSTGAVVGALRETPAVARFGPDPLAALIGLLSASGWPDLDDILTSIPGSPPPGEV